MSAAAPRQAPDEGLPPLIFVSFALALLAVVGIALMSFRSLEERTASVGRMTRALEMQERLDDVLYPQRAGGLAKISLDKHRRAGLPIGGWNWSWTASAAGSRRPSR